MAGIVIVGAGQAGFSLAEKLRGGGYAGELTLIGEESHPPYQRPPLSKKYLLGELPAERLYLRPPEYYAQHEITLRTDTRIVSIDPGAMRLQTADGEVIPYDQLALTTGSRPRKLPDSVGGTMDGVYYVRTLADIDTMSHEFEPDRRLLVVGGGYIGLEIAAVASLKGLRVTLVEAEDRILKRVAAPETSDYFRTLHHGHDIDLREATGLARLLGEDRIAGAELADGSTIETDFAVIGIGILPETRLAEQAGLETENGIRVDAVGKTSDPHIFAAGDCTSFPYRGRRVRLESVPNAIDQAEAVAAAMLGGTEPYIAKPWFWSDQYDVKLQIAGLNAGYDRTIVREGGRPGSNSVWYFADDELLAVDAMNDPRAYMTGKRWIEGGISPDPDKLSDPETDLKDLA